MPTLHRIPIRIAGIQIELTSPLSIAELGIEERLGPFFVANKKEKPLVSVSLFWQESAEPPAPCGDLIYDPGSIWTMHREGTDCYATLRYQETQPQAVLQANAGWDDLTLTEHRRSPLWQSLLNIGAGELILRTAILCTGGLVFHASGLDDNGKGIVFVGHSGAGKSTQLELWNQELGVISMNDDRIAVRANKTGAMCYGTPWGGTSDIARNHAVPLSALVLLEQASKNAVEPLSPAVAAPQLAARAFLPYWDSTLIQRALDNLNTLLKQVPVYRLRCRPERAVIPLVRSVI
ncbi:MAG: hypothetical protein SD837_09015 [Candidatus Electrothrix scaldis]|nr:MAG: hypothetical protein SD837_09015 [Candidatus Electrothrix sp. GW3-3]